MIYIFFNDHFGNIKYHNIITLTSSQNSAFKQMLSYSIGCENMPKEVCIYILKLLYGLFYFMCAELNDRKLALLVF